MSKQVMQGEGPTGEEVRRGTVAARMCDFLFVLFAAGSGTDADGARTSGEGDGRGFALTWCVYWRFG